METGCHNEYREHAASMGAVRQQLIAQVTVLTISMRAGNSISAVKAGMSAAMAANGMSDVREFLSVIVTSVRIACERADPQRRRRLTTSSQKHMGVPMTTATFRLCAGRATRQRQQEIESNENGYRFFDCAAPGWCIRDSIDNGSHLRGSWRGRAGQKFPPLAFQDRRLTLFHTAAG